MESRNGYARRRLNGEKVRFSVRRRDYPTPLTTNVTEPLPLYTTDGIARTLRPGEVFYLTAAHAANQMLNGTIIIFDDTNDDDTITSGNIAYKQGANVYTSVYFKTPQPMTNPKVNVTGRLGVNKVEGTGIIRSA